MNPSQPNLPFEPVLTTQDEYAWRGTMTTLPGLLPMPDDVITRRGRNLGPFNRISVSVDAICWHCRGTGKQRVEIHGITYNTPISTETCQECDGRGFNAFSPGKVQTDWLPFIPSTQQPFLPKIPGFTLLGVGEFTCPNDVQGEQCFKVPVYRCDAFLQALVRAGLCEDEPEPGAFPETEFVLLPPPGTDGHFKFGSGPVLYEYQIAALRLLRNSMVHDEVTVPAGTDPAVHAVLAMPGSRYAEMRRIDAPFLMARTPLTNAIWWATIHNPDPDENNSEARARIRTQLARIGGEYAGREDQRPIARHPHTDVSWEDVTSWAQGRGFRLPTEMEWEFACRAGTSTAYCFGNDYAALGEYAWFRGNTQTIQSVAGKRTNAFGLHDMHGLVWEWCADLFEAGASYRFDRGGGWSFGASFCTSAIRNYWDPSNRNDYRGFRPVMSLPSAVTQAEGRA